MVATRISSKRPSRAVQLRKRENHKTEASANNVLKSKSTGNARKSKSAENSRKQNSFEKVCIQFPSEIIKKEDIVLGKKYVYQADSSDNKKEIHFKGTYKGLPILCDCIPRYEGIHEMLFHEFQMSLQLSVCRNMGSIFTVFEATLSEMNIDITNVSPEHTALFVIKQDHMSNSLKRHIDKGRKLGLAIEPMHAIQMAINIFSMLVDAHKMSIYLVDITKRSIFVDVDGSLYFSAFRSALSPTSRMSPKPWVKFDHLVSPEKDNRDFVHSDNTDIFLACTLVLHIILQNEKRTDRVFRIDHRNKRVLIFEENMDNRHKLLLDALRPGLEYDPKNRAPASEILDSLEEIRNRSILTKNPQKSGGLSQ